MIDVDSLPKAELSLSGPIRICHAPSNATYKILKRSDLILDVMNRIKKENSRVETVIIEGVSNEECVKIKKSCHLHIVGLRYGFGLNAIESAAIGIVPIVQLPNFVRMAYPDTPIVHGTESNLFESAMRLVLDESRLEELGQVCRQWVKREFDAPILIRKYWYLYDMIYHGLSVEYPEIFNDEPANRTFAKVGT
jgi:glycosyltransferase involved in cell wall biosynthesis